MEWEKFGREGARKQGRKEVCTGGRKKEARSKEPDACRKKQGARKRKMI